MAAVYKAAKRQGRSQTPRVDVKVKDIRRCWTSAKTSLTTSPASQTMTYVEHDLPVMRKLADAWAVGDIDVLRATVVTDSYGTCIYSLFESPRLAKFGFENIRERIRDNWLAAAEAALAKHRSTFAVLPMGQLLRPDGLAAELGKRGYLVEAPGQESAAGEPVEAAAPYARLVGAAESRSIAPSRPAPALARADPMLDSRHESAR
jgi:hypothetical protein